MRTLVRLGYVAMSVNVPNSSPSQTMTYTRFKQIDDREAAITKLERIAESNIHNCIRLLKHNAANDISFFRLSSRLVPLATHEDLAGWRYLESISEPLLELGGIAKKKGMRIDFHPDHFVVVNSPKKEVLLNALKVLTYHYHLLKGIGIEPKHRAVLHVGGAYQNKAKALEQFVLNWAIVPRSIQDMIMIENDDKSFDMMDCLYLCNKLGLPFVFDYHHHLANHSDPDWKSHWNRVVGTWEVSKLPIKMHISSPKSDKQYRSHADFVDPSMFLDFLKGINSSVPQIDCMIEAKKKDQALFQLMKDLKSLNAIEAVDGASFYLKKGV
ncbi:UV-damage endonuclease [Scopulibacillus darangshiensis]|uniref:UV-damage endonuclease n=1 Tax=Scopulibacillus darangshiensis TaxID=442528 RepID=A0A4R2P4A3_9BACL|nr:UV DNA damage repair endonuclease UvsE [Scopulibacillus darangshiensis]TCP28884.1 UV-damage endonuclease [Scopulibacillus darangshiensis]